MAADGLDDVLRLSQCPANLDETLHEGVVGHGHLAPHGVEHLLLGDQLAGTADEMRQHIEGLGAKPYFLAVAKERLAIEVDRDVPKVPRGLRLCSRSGFRRDFVHDSSSDRDFRRL